MNNQYKQRTITCMGCGKTVTKRMPLGRKYCSRMCYESTPRPQRMTGKHILCAQCGREAYKRKSYLDSGRLLFCSKACANEYQGRNKLHYNCLVCGKSFKWSKSRLKQNNPKYCSIVCRDKDPNYNGQVLGNLAQSKKCGLNRLEKAGELLLGRSSVNYKSQFLINNKILVDVYVPDYSIVIQWDGDYWHGYNKEIGEVDKRVHKRMLLDKSQDAYMRKCGYIVLRFWEHEIYNEEDMVVDTIKSTIRNATARVQAAL